MQRIAGFDQRRQRRDGRGDAAGRNLLCILQADFTGAPLTGSISDWAGQIEREAEKQPKAKAPKKIPERSS
ncbi:MAG: hypothetical protein E5V53_23185, partial [Mesorhizobium sp.]